MSDSCSQESFFFLKIVKIPLICVADNNFYEGIDLSFYVSLSLPHLL